MDYFDCTHNVICFGWSNVRRKANPTDCYPYVIPSLYHTKEVRISLQGLEGCIRVEIVLQTDPPILRHACVEIFEFL